MYAIKFFLAAVGLLGSVIFAHADHLPPMLEGSWCREYNENFNDYYSFYKRGEDCEAGRLKIERNRLRETGDGGCQIVSVKGPSEARRGWLYEIGLRCRDEGGTIWHREIMKLWHDYLDLNAIMTHTESKK
jgi:hypothetical protein